MSQGLGETEAYWDARLTPLGEQQSRELAERLRMAHPSVQLVATSPLTRAIQTGSLAFPEAQSGRPPFVATSLARERIWSHQCDRRRSREELEAEFPHVDFAEVAPGADEMWDTKELLPEPNNNTATSARAYRLLEWLWARPEEDIAVVSHWIFLKHLLGLSPEHPELLADFGNAEARPVVLATRAPATPATEPPAGKEEL